MRQGEGFQNPSPQATKEMDDLEDVLDFLRPLVSFTSPRSGKEDRLVPDSGTCSSSDERPKNAG